MMKKVKKRAKSVKKTKTKKPKQKRKKEITIKKEYQENLINFAKYLHALGINVVEHALNLGVEEEDLKAIEKELFKEKFVSDNDKKLLQAILKDLMNAAQELVKIEATLYKDTKPLVEAANGKKPLFRIFNKEEDLKEVIHEIRNLLINSMHYENKGIFKTYPLLLNTVERTIKILIFLEAKWGKPSTRARIDFFKIHYDLRRMIHNDLYIISREIEKLYNLRLSMYNWLIESDKSLKKRVAPTLENERNQLQIIQNHYLALYKRHTDSLSQAYNTVLKK